MTSSIRKAYLLIALLLGAVASANGEERTPSWVEAIENPQYFAVYVADIDRSTDWYRTVFGLQSLGGSTADDDAWQIENLGNKQLLVEIIRDNRTEKIPRAIGFRKVGFYVPDVEKVADRIERATGERPRIVSFEEMNQRILQMRDPDGNTIQLFSPLKRKK